jgi:hypothetical protein
VEALYCDATIDNHPIYLIVDTGSTSSVISKSFLDSLGRTIDEPSSINLVDINGGKKRSLGKVKDLPITLKGTTIPITVDVSESKQYTIIVGNDWITKTKAIINYDHQTLDLNYLGKNIRCKVTCWEKQKFNDDGRPIGIEPQDKGKGKETYSQEDELEFEEPSVEDLSYCALVGNSNEQPLVEMDKSTITIGQREEPISYLQELESMQQPLLTSKPLHKGWKGPKAICWCDRYLEQESDICATCLIKAQDWELVQYLGMDQPKEPDKQSDLTREQQRQFDNLLEEYQDIIANEDSPPGHTDLVNHRIVTEDTLPIKQRPYRISPTEHEFVGKEIDRMLDQGIIRPSYSPWTSPIVLVKKKNGQTRFCVDYRKLNKITKRDAYPLPRIDEILDSLGKAKWFTSLDMASGYWQVEMNESDREKTAFITKQGTYEFNVMPFGLTNAPATFQRLMDRIFYDIKDKYVLVYLDDINIYSATFEDHLKHLKNVFERVRKANLKLNLDKCHFCKKELAFLGHVINHTGIKPDPAKVEKVKNFAIPTNITELRGFIGLASYYRRFILNFATIVEPMNKLLRKNIPYKWDEKCQTAFEQLKDKLTTAPILTYPDFSKPFLLYTDASYKGLGAVLAQLDEEGNEHVIAYASRSLVGAEVNYATTEIECLATVWAMKYFRPYIYLQEFSLITDHSALQWMLNNPTPSKRMTRWILTIMDYPFRIQYRKGRKHQNADALSRLPSIKNT